jgi:hypothetical protein
MKYITTLVLLTLLLVGCSATTAQVKTEPVAAATPPSTVTINLPNWPGWVYTNPTTDAFVILVVKDPSKFPVPKDFTFTGEGETVPVVMSLVVPSTEKK